MSSTVLEARGLRYDYGERQAVRDLSFTLEAGEVMGFLGPNGAGKTTAIRVLTTIFTPTSGAFSVTGIGHHDAIDIRRRIGVLSESQGFPPHSTAMEYLVFYGALFGLSRKDSAAKAEALLETVGLGGRKHSLISSYSRGMRQRLGIARALINDPAVVFLDEPTLGLDPRGQEELGHLIRSIAEERGTAVVLCSHLLDEVEQVCDSVVILHEGTVVTAGTVKDVVGDGRLHDTFLRLTGEPLPGATA